MMTHDTEGGDGPQHRSSVHIKLEHQGNLRMVQHGLRTIQTLHTSCIAIRSKSQDCWESSANRSAALTKGRNQVLRPRGVSSPPWIL